MVRSGQTAREGAVGVTVLSREEPLAVLCPVVHYADAGDVVHGVSLAASRISGTASSEQSRAAERVTALPSYPLSRHKHSQTPARTSEVTNRLFDVSPTPA